MEEVRTLSSTEYKFYPVQTFSKRVSVQAPHDAWISFTSGPNDTTPIVEIIFGGWGNTKTAIKFNKEESNKAEEDTPGLLTPDEHREFTLEWTPNGTLFQIYGGDDTSPFLSWRNAHAFPVTNFGVKTTNGSSGDWIIDDMNFMGTVNSSDYIYNRVEPFGGRIDFKVKAPHDAHVCLTPGPTDSTPIHEIVIGGWGNTICGILYNKDLAPVAESGPGLLSADEFKSFWIEWNFARLKVGISNNPEPFLEWTTIIPHVVTHFGIRTTDGSEGLWAIPSSNAGGGVEIEGGEITFGVGPGVATPVTDDAGWVPPPPEPAKPTPTMPDVLPEPPGWIPQPHLPTDDARGDRVPRAEPKSVLPPTPEAAAGQSNWVQAQNGAVPPDALRGGDDGGEPIYVARAQHAGDLIPGKLVPSHRIVYVAYGGREHGKTHYEVLVAPASSVGWVPASGGLVPGNAIPGGSTAAGEKLYIGRAPHAGTNTIGKIHPSHGNLYISYGGKEIGYMEYEVLVKN